MKANIEILKSTLLASGADTQTIADIVKSLRDGEGISWAIDSHPVAVLIVESVCYDGTDKITDIDIETLEGYISQLQSAINHLKNL